MSANSLLNGIRLFLALVLATGAAAAATNESDRTIAQLAGETRDALPVRTEGVVDDLFADDVDPRFRVLSLRDGSDSMLVSIPARFLPEREFAKLYGARVRISGLFKRQSSGERKCCQRHIDLDDDSKLEILSVSHVDLLDYPPLVIPSRISADEVAAWGRRSTTGLVVATWGRNNVLLRETRDAETVFVGIELADGESLPPYGCLVKAIGTAETDLFRIILTRARIKILSTEAGDSSEPSGQKSPKELYFTSGGRTAFDAAGFGKRVLATGTVAGLPSAGAPDSVLTLDCDGLVVPVDVGHCSGLLGRIATGCRLRVRGTCIHEVGKWRPTQPFPQIKRLFLVVRDDNDVEILSFLPWWTPRHSFFTILLLLLIVLGILTWNFLLHRLAEQRGKELADETLARAESEFKIYERTRLAVELHDSVAQNLTSAIVELRVAKNTTDDPAAAAGSLDLAMKTISATNEEIRNCIWDLRSRALEDNDFNQAIRTTLAPHINGIDLVIRFNVPRTLVSDNTAHNILRIIRELSVNALRHGRATRIRIAGAIEDGRLLFSVKDDGCGFDPATAPSMEQGHFGLEGIRERVRAFEGTFTLDSRPGGGTKATISIRLPKEEQS